MAIGGAAVGLVAGCASPQETEPATVSAPFSERLAEFEARGEGLTPQDTARIEGQELLRMAGCMLADPNLQAEPVYGGEGLDNDFFGTDGGGAPADYRQPVVVSVLRQADNGQLRLEFTPGRDATVPADTRVEALIEFSSHDPLMQGPLTTDKLTRANDLTTFNVVSATTTYGGLQSGLYEDGGVLLDPAGADLTDDAAIQWGQSTDEALRELAHSANVAC